MTWEYLYQTHNLIFGDGEPLHDRLASWGKQGWELVSVLRSPFGFDLFLKRPVRDVAADLPRPRCDIEYMDTSTHRGPSAAVVPSGPLSWAEKLAFSKGDGPS